ncbi:hypothetical protein PCANC_02428 [Puccinia coronata f. sp. avenae]|uniref:HAT C-terminal dimerisation domain-containing protein n=1 Tax=Puccinia coronata f. sp. avenae TaxID=200324 RepID=A0A2N5W4U7_9BASI|nr:hypothetical protein PCANC_02428 [Puccinia coronata f. sp. avenae]
MKAFMAITAHGITSDWKMLDVLVAMPAVEGRHTGQNFANIFVDTLDHLELSDHLVCITADNASSNSTLATHVERRLGGIFEADDQLLGCMAHVINLAAHDGIKVFGGIPTLSGSDEEITLDKMDINNLITEPDGAEVNIKSVVTRIHGLATYVRGSPQRREGFQAVIDFINSQSPKTPVKDKILILDVKTRWNSTFLMLQRASELKHVCTTYCGSQPEASKYSLTKAKWEKVEQMIEFLEPLHKVTNILCGSQYPTLSMSLPIYISLVKNIYQVRSQYDLAQLIPAADEMIKKITKYLILALEKPAPICAMILDPRIKLCYFKKNESFLSAHSISKLTAKDALTTFKLEAKRFDQSPSRMNPTSSQGTSGRKTKKAKPMSAIESDVWGESTVANDLNDKIRQYIAEVKEPSHTNILYYWANHTKVYPSLSEMAKCFLAIPATSAPSERVFSKSKTIFGSQRHSLSSSSVEHLLCVKEWYQKFDVMMETSSIKEIVEPKAIQDDDKGEE